MNVSTLAKNQAIDIGKTTPDHMFLGPPAILANTRVNSIRVVTQTRTTERNIPFLLSRSSTVLAAFMSNMFIKSYWNESNLNISNLIKVGHRQMMS